MSGHPPKITLFQKFFPVFVMIPVLMALHLAWYKMQYNDALVSPEDRKRMKSFKFLDKYKFLLGESSATDVEKTE